SAATMVPPYHPSEWEKTNYYHGLSDDPPVLLYRSNFLRPFPRPTGGSQNIPEKTIHGDFKTPLNAVWHTVAPKICDSLKARRIQYCALHTSRFITHGEDGQTTRGPVVIWITVLPNSTTVEDAHLVTPDILALLEDNGVHDVVVEWTEGVVE
ncbi:hypothetical protein FOMPIDRAFT_1085692, partial [Fomitopsis schrenkii]